jgi:protein subunit release factor A
MILEIQGGAGGDESSLFAAELALMYQGFAEQKDGDGTSLMNPCRMSAGTRMCRLK